MESGVVDETPLALTLDSVDSCLDDVRPYLKADGGNVKVLGVEGGIVTLELEGVMLEAFNQCPSFHEFSFLGLLDRCMRDMSELLGHDEDGHREGTRRQVRAHAPVSLRLLAAASAHVCWATVFSALSIDAGAACRGVVQLGGDKGTLTVAAIDSHLDILRSAIGKYGGIVEVCGVDDRLGTCTIKYVGPPAIGSGIRTALKDKFPRLRRVDFVED